jgi:hypothetical protein
MPENIDTEIYSEVIEPNGIYFSLTHMGNNCFEYSAEYDIPPQFAGIITLEHLNNMLGYYLALASSRNRLILDNSLLYHIIADDRPLSIFFNEVNHDIFPDSEGQDPESTMDLGHVFIAGAGTSEAHGSIGYLRYMIYRDRDQIPEAAADECVKNLHVIDEDSYSFTRNAHDLARFAIIAYEVIPAALNGLITFAQNNEFGDLRPHISSN